MATPNIVPRADSEGGLGTASKYWASAYIDLIYVGAGKVGRDADNYFDFVQDNQISIRIGGSNEIIIDPSQMFPATNNGMALGYPGNGWSDLFLASGAVINFDNGNVTLTHSSNALTLADGDRLVFGTGTDLQLYHDGSNSYIQQSGTGDLYIQQNADDKDLVFQCDDGSGGSTAYLTLDGSVAKTTVSKPLLFADNISAEYGADTDMIMYHSGSNGAIENYTGNLTITNNNDDGDILFKSDNGSGGITEYFRLDGGIKRTIFTENIGLEDNTQILIGSGNDLQIYHDATDSFIKNSHGNLVFRNTKQNKDVLFQGDDGQASDDTIATYFYLDGSSATHDGSATTALYTNWPDKSRISLGTSHDAFMVHSGNNFSLNNDVGNMTFTNTTNDGAITFQASTGSAAAATYLTLDGSNARINFDVDGQFADGKKLRVGDGADLQLYHSSSESHIYNQTGDIKITNDANDGDIIFMSDDGSGGTTEYIRVDGGQTRTEFAKPTQHADNAILNIGSSSNMQIYHNGTDSFILNGSSGGNLTISNNQDDGDIIFSCDDGSGGVETYFFLDGSSGGGAPFTQFPDASVISMGTGQDLRIQHDGSNSYIEQTGTGDLYIKQTVDDGDILFQADDGSGGVTTYIEIDGGSVATQFSKRALFVDNVNAEFGSGRDLKIYHDGSNSYIDDTGTGNLYVRGDAQIILSAPSGGEVYAKFIKDGACEFRHNDSTKLATTSAGVTVTGTVSATSYKTGSTTVLQGEADVILGSSGGTGTISLTTHSSVPFKIENDDSISMSPAKIVMTNLPTSDPGTTGQLWNDNGTLKISAGG